MKQVICHGCGKVKHIRENDAVFYCSDCGACNDVPRAESSALPLNCLVPKGFEWPLPSGHIEPAMGDTLYVDSRGTYLTREDFKRIYKCDPKIALERMRKLGKEGKPGITNLSTLSKRK